MAFCTSCGAQIADGAKFCTGCGVTQVQAPQAVASSQPVAPAPAQPAAVQPAPKQGGGALKIVLIVLAVVFGLIILIIAGGIGMGVYIAHKTKVRQHGNSATISTPWGEVNTTTDPSKVAEQLGVEVYPGATPLKEGASVSGIPGMSIVTARFESDDPIDKIEQFYKEKYPEAMVSTASENARTIAYGGGKGAITIVLHNEDGKTRIDISRVERGSKTNDSGQ